jgi:hypothetical protein
MTGVVITGQPFNMGDLYLAGTTSITIPNGVASVQIWAQAAGGAAFGRLSPVDGSAGGGGGFAYLTRAVLAGEWGTTLTVAIGSGSASNNGGNTTVSGTLNGSAVSVTCNGGTKGTSLADGTGGTASGGDTNITGESGSGYVSTPPGEEAPGTPGRAGGFGFSGALMGSNLGAPGDGALASQSSDPGFGGYIQVVWS